MRRALSFAIVAAIGNFLQGWDQATLSGSLTYIRQEFRLEDEPIIDSLINTIPLIGAAIITVFSGALSDRFGRRPMLIISSVFYIAGGVLTIWCPDVYILLLARLVFGFGIGLAVAFVPAYITEVSPSEMRGLLSTLPQLTGTTGTTVAYDVDFGMSLQSQPSWRLLFGGILFLSIVYFVFTVFFLPEAPTWLVSKGRMEEAKHALQRLRGREDVSGEMALLAEGVGVTATELPVEQESTGVKDMNMPYRPKRRIAWVRRPATERSLLGSVLDPVRIRWKRRASNEQADVEKNPPREGESYASDDMYTPLLSDHGTNGGGDPKRVILCMEAVSGSQQHCVLVIPEGDASETDQCVEAKASVSQHPSRPALVPPCGGLKHVLFLCIGMQILQQVKQNETHNQFSGINGVLYYTPQILEQAGVGIILSKLGLSSVSASLLISSVIFTLQLPCILVAMRLMDVSGRRSLLLGTIPLLIASLLLLVLVNMVDLGAIAHAALSTVSVVVYMCCFVMGFGPIPSIICSEIFPTRVRGKCIAACSVTAWLCSIVVAFTLPLMQRAVGLSGVCGAYAFDCLVSLGFIFFLVPETKGAVMPP
ncbi:monosaccharide-sensing protein 2-like [Musa acuminata AAA Group]|uniref:monosaccharide-sensing protein 2-like n=1 Tax=Musa acuminata AAA Group TaxID=214697 RepID=UPI0031DD5C0E